MKTEKKTNKQKKPASKPTKKGNREGWIMNLKVEQDNEDNIRKEANDLDRDFTWIMNQRMRDSYLKTKTLK